MARSEIRSAPRRRYRKRARAAQEQRTRDRITRAAVHLHGTVGPAHTTIRSIADRAGVQRATVYRHFPDEQSLFDACTAHFFGEHPMPDPASWRSTPAGGERLGRGLAELYAWYGEAEPMISNSLRDLEHVPPLTWQRFLAYVEQVRAVLLDGRRERGRRRERAIAAIGHAIAFTTWRSLVREQGLRDEEAVELMCALLATDPGPGPLERQAGRSAAKR